MGGREEGRREGGRKREKGREGGKVVEREREAGTGLPIPFIQCTRRSRKNLTQSVAQIPSHG